jgi:hypothetical protein
MASPGVVVSNTMHSERGDGRAIPTADGRDNQPRSGALAPISPILAAVLGSVLLTLAAIDWLAYGRLAISLFFR